MLWYWSGSAPRLGTQVLHAEPCWTFTCKRSGVLGHHQHHYPRRNSNTVETGNANISRSERYKLKVAIKECMQNQQTNKQEDNKQAKNPPWSVVISRILGLFSSPLWGFNFFHSALSELWMPTVVVVTLGYRTPLPPHPPLPSPALRPHPLPMRARFRMIIAYRPLPQPRKLGLNQ